MTPARQMIEEFRTRLKFSDYPSDAEVDTICDLALQALDMSGQREEQRLPIDRPCSACSGGDWKMEYHKHSPPFRKAAPHSGGK